MGVRLSALGIIPLKRGDKVSEAIEVRWERMFPDQLEAAFARSPILYLPYGMCEPHGPHNTLGLDALKAHALCCRAAETGGGMSRRRNIGTSMRSATTPPGQDARSARWPGTG